MCTSAAVVDLCSGLLEGLVRRQEVAALFHCAGARPGSTPAGHCLNHFQLPHRWPADANRRRAAHRNVGTLMLQEQQHGSTVVVTRQSGHDINGPPMLLTATPIHRSPLLDTRRPD